MTDTPTRQKIHTHSVALLATGDEVVSGDVLNTNAQQIALRLAEKSIGIGMHAVTNDVINEIEQAITFLLKNHSALIITGGLGPTSDDLTRYALSNCLNQSLSFDESTWQSICDRLDRLGYHTPPESNRQQALFPIGATIIPNTNGTAAGCYIQHNKQWIFMLPGPPSECLPMVDQVVIPLLLKANYQTPLFREKWLLFRASEGKVAQEIDQLVKPYDCVTGYRLCYPYLEFKLYSKNQAELNSVIQLIQPILQPYLVGNGKQSASEQFKQQLIHSEIHWQINDQATGGYLEYTLKNPNTLQHLSFTEKNSAQENTVSVVISGLNEYWTPQKNMAFAEIQMVIHAKNGDKTLQTTLPMRGDSVKLMAAEWICQQLLKLS